MPQDFVFSYGGDEFWLDDLRMDDAVELEDRLGEWGTWRPIGLAKHCFTLSAAMLRHGTVPKPRERTDDEVAKILDGTTFGELRKMWALRELDLPEAWEDGLPKPEAGGPTGSS